ncbi:hypothetical protein CTI12_AA589850 [Artemisia annua]|uniref:Uncharacterized protein n=1 Tax=Artemisia annua TaxID=35608 RepID=A0A2U1KLB1_ARTAN|nr:hypothetical protein CTI12_AA589850 [Artemisia annua]
MNCVRESVWERIGYGGGGNHGTSRKYDGKSYRNRVFNGRTKSFASFMFYNYPEQWKVVDLWKMFKGYGMRLCSISFGKQYLKVFNAHDRKPESRNKSGSGEVKEKHNIGNRSRDGRSYSEVLRGKERSCMADEEPKYEKKDEREIMINEDDMNGEVIRKAIIGEVRNTEFIKELPEFCRVVGLLDVEVKYMGGMEVMIVLKSEETAKKVVENTEHGIRRWLWKIRRATALSRVSGRFTWISVSGVPISCWKEGVFKNIAQRWGTVKDSKNCNLYGSQSVIAGRVLIHTCEPALIEETLFIRIGRNRIKIFVREDLKDIIEFEINDAAEKEKEDKNNIHTAEYDGCFARGDNKKDMEDQESGTHAPREMNVQTVEVESSKKENAINEEGRLEKVNCKVAEKNYEEHRECVNFEMEDRHTDKEGSLGSNLKNKNEARPTTTMGDDVGPCTPIQGKIDGINNNEYGKDIDGGENTHKNSKLENTDNHGFQGTKKQQLPKLDNTVVRGSHSGSGDRIGKKRKMSPGGSFVWNVKSTEGDEYKVEHVCNASSDGNVNKGGEETGLESECSLNMVKQIGKQIGVVWDEQEPCKCSLMKVISLNIRGLKRKGKAGWLKEIICREKPCVFGLQETKSSDVEEQWVEDIWGSRNFGFAPANARGKSGGLLMIWDNNVFSGTSAVGGDRFIAVKGTWKGVDGDVILVNVYGAHSSDQKTELWNRISALMGTVVEHIVLVPPDMFPAAYAGMVHHDNKVVACVGVAIAHMTCMVYVLSSCGSLKDERAMDGVVKLSIEGVYLEEDKGGGGSGRWSDMFVK